MLHVVVTLQHFQKLSDDIYIYYCFFTDLFNYSYHCFIIFCFEKMMAIVMLHRSHFLHHLKKE